MKARKQSSLTYPIIFKMLLSASAVTGKTGLAPTVYLSKNSGSFSLANGAVTEIGYGYYALAPNATDRNTLGELDLYATSGSETDPTYDNYDIVDYDPFTTAISSLDKDDIALAVWGYTSRVLTYSPTNTASINDDGLSFVRGDTIDYVFTGVNCDYQSKAYFTIKENYKDLDSAALLQIVSGSSGSGVGLIVLNGSPIIAGSSKASLTSASTPSTVHLVVSASVVAQIPYSSSSYYYDLEITTTAGSVTTPYVGEFTLVRDVTKTIT